LQGPEAIEEVAGVVSDLGCQTPLVLRDTVALESVGEKLSGPLDKIAGAIEADFGGECSPQEIDRLVELFQSRGADGVVGVGGGKALDTAKAVAIPAGLPLIIVPTLASTDAPTSALSVVYDEEGSFLEYRFHGKHPDAVVVDTSIVAGAPVRFLVAGMGDALATHFEAQASAATRKQTMAGGAPTHAALALARLSYDTVLENGVAAKLAAERGAITPAVEAIVEANTLLSGLGFESGGGVAAAHSIHNGLTALHGTHDYWHGEKVAFGLIAMLIMEGRPTALIEEVLDFCIAIGLPVCLEDIGIGDASREDLAAVAEAACVEEETMHNQPFEVRPAMVVDAMLTADTLGKGRKEGTSPGSPGL
jgi:glycerol dehydrogenase